MNAIHKRLQNFIHLFSQFKLVRMRLKHQNHMKRLAESYSSQKLRTSLPVKQTNAIKSIRNNNLHFEQLKSVSSLKPPNHWVLQVIYYPYQAEFSTTSIREVVNKLNEKNQIQKWSILDLNRLLFTQIHPSHIIRTNVEGLKTLLSAFSRSTSRNCNK
jgi:hypothetical protein